MAVRLDRVAVASALRSSSGFRTLTKNLETSAVSTATHLASTRVQRRTGAYADNFESTFTPKVSRDVLGILRLLNSTPYAEIIESGSRPHLIRVRNAKVLANVDTGEVFGVEVNHPGTAAQHIIRDALLAVASGRDA